MESLHLGQLELEAGPEVEYQGLLAQQRVKLYFVPAANHVLPLEHDDDEIGCHCPSRSPGTYVRAGSCTGSGFDNEDLLHNVTLKTVGTRVPFPNAQDVLHTVDNSPEDRMARHSGRGAVLGRPVRV